MRDVCRTLLPRDVIALVNFAQSLRYINFMGKTFQILRRLCTRSTRYMRTRRVMQSLPFSSPPYSASLPSRRSFRPTLGINSRRAARSGFSTEAIPYKAFHLALLLQAASLISPFRSACVHSPTFAQQQTGFCHVSHITSFEPDHTPQNFGNRPFSGKKVRYTALILRRRSHGWSSRNGRMWVGSAERAAGRTRMRHREHL
jgi:hypothetical protein